MLPCLFSGECIWLLYVYLFIRGRLDRAIAYIKDQEKTYNPAWEQRGFPALSSLMQCAMEQAAAQGMDRAIGYVTDGEKTDYQYYVSGIRCDPQSAREAMALTKRRFQKEGGIVLFHGYQSFKPGRSPRNRHMRSAWSWQTSSGATVLRW